MMNPGRLLKLKKAWDVFTRNHPKLPLFLSAVNKKGIQEGTIIEVKVTTQSGEVISSNIKLTATDLELLNELSKK